MHSPEFSVTRRAPLRPLLVKELWEVLGGRALWTLLLLLSPLVGYSFFQAVSLYGEASLAARQSPVLASSLSPLDGILVPTFGGLYVGVTLLFPFVAIRVLGHEKESGALRLLVQLPYRPLVLIAAKLAAVLAAWIFAGVLAVSACIIWIAAGGHIYLPETLNLLLGQSLYGLLIGAVALFAAAISEGAATAAIITLAFTISSWVLDFTVAGRPGIAGLISRISLTQTLRTFEQGLFSVSLLVGMIAAICGFIGLAVVWLPPGIPARVKLSRSAVCILLTGAVLAEVTQIKAAFDVTEDRRNSFSISDQRALSNLMEPLVITIQLSPEDPRYTDLQRNVLARLERTLPNVTLRLGGGRQNLAKSTGDDAYGEVSYTYAGRTDISRSTSPREILPLLYGLANVPVPVPSAADDYPGYPLVANGQIALVWFFGGLPLLIVSAWWWSRRPSHLHRNPYGTEVSHDR